VIPALGRLRHEDLEFEFEASLELKVKTLSQKNPKTNRRKVAGDPGTAVFRSSYLLFQLSNCRQTLTSASSRFDRNIGPLSLDFSLG
jgi:hypothetical protein